jgi:hypothetical protein
MTANLRSNTIVTVLTTAKSLSATLTTGLNERKDPIQWKKLFVYDPFYDEKLGIDILNHSTKFVRLNRVLCLR